MSSSPAVAVRAAARLIWATLSAPWAMATSVPSSSLPPGKWKYTDPRGAPLSASTSENAVPR